MRILILGNNPSTLVNFNGALIEALLQAGHRVRTAGAGRETRHEQWLAARGVDYVELPMERAGLNPVIDLGTFASVLKLVRGFSPDQLIAYMIKPVVYGLIAARIAGVPRRAAIISGLGYGFTSDPDERGRAWVKRKVVSALARTAYAMALPQAQNVIFQNPDDLAHFAQLGLTRRGQATSVVSGSGVDVTHYTPAAMPEGPMTFLMIARLLRDKGIHEYINAARIVKRSRPDARFQLLGPFDPNPSAVTPAEVESWVREGLIEYLGAVDDVRPVIANCHVLVLPSYREGTPRTVLEAMAMARPIITTDVPGCRETVTHGGNGLLVKAHDSEDLASAIKRVLDNPQDNIRMGRASLALARSRYDARIVAEDTMKLLGLHGAAARASAFEHAA